MIGADSNVGVFASEVFLWRSQASFHSLIFPGNCYPCHSLINRLYPFSACRTSEMIAEREASIFALTRSDVLGLHAAARLSVCTRTFLHCGRSRHLIASSAWAAQRVLGVVVTAPITRYHLRTIAKVEPWLDDGELRDNNRKNCYVSLSGAHFIGFDKSVESQNLNLACFIHLAEVN
jgi:hypothetical protein